MESRMHCGRCKSWKRRSQFDLILSEHSGMCHACVDALYAESKRDREKEPS